MCVVYKGVCIGISFYYIKERFYSQIVRMSIWKTIVRFYEPARSRPTLFMRWILQSILFSLFDVFTILVFKWVAGYAESQNMLWLSTIAWIFFFLSLIYTICKYFIRHWWWAQSYYPFRAHVFQKYMTRFFQLDYTTVDRYGTGRFVYIIGKWSDEWIGAIIETIYSFIDVTVKFIFFFLVIGSVNIWYGLLFFVVYLVMLIAVYVINKGTLYWRGIRIQSEELISKQLVRMIMSKQEVLQSRKIDQELWLLLDQNSESDKIAIKLNNYVWTMFNLPLLVLYAIIVLVLFYAVNAMKNGTFLFTDFVVATTMIGYLMASITHSVEVFKNLTKNFSHIEKIWKFFDEAPTMHGYDVWSSFLYNSGDIVLDNISFAYDTGTDVLSHFSCRLMGWKKTALVGVSGGGKSTVIKLIAGYLQPDSGSILVDGQDLSEVALKSYYPHVGYLTQDPSVFDGTVYDNLIYALDKKPSQKRLRQAIVDAGCDFIDRLPQGLDTEIGERGVRLSWWQRQRLAIARIFLKNPEIVLLDEPTSALDSVSEEKISQALHMLFAGRTVVVIAHRLQTVKEADHIIVVGDGWVIEEWSHSALVKKKGAYARMLELQTSF